MGKDRAVLTQIQFAKLYAWIEENAVLFEGKTVDEAVAIVKKNKPELNGVGAYHIRSVAKEVDLGLRTTRGRARNAPATVAHRDRLFARVLLKMIKWLATLNDCDPAEIVSHRDLVDLEAREGRSMEARTFTQQEE